MNVWCILGPRFKSIIVFRGIGRVVVNQFEVNCSECSSTDGWAHRVNLILLFSFI